MSTSDDSVINNSLLNWYHQKHTLPFYFRCPWGASSWCIGARTLKLRWSRPPCFPRRWSPISFPIVKLYQNTTTLSLSRTWPFPSFMAHGCLTCFFSTVLFCLFLFRGLRTIGLSVTLFGRFQNKLFFISFFFFVSGFRRLPLAIFRVPSGSIPKRKICKSK